jgi:hypothetical protein
MSTSLMDILLAQPSAQERFQQIAPLLGGGAPPVGGTVSAGSGGSSDWEDVARRIAENRYGYTPEDFNKLDSIISRESNWDPNAVNDSSGAYGIPQILPSAHPNANLENDPRGQINWLLNYVQERYGGIDQALAFKNANGWY